MVGGEIGYEENCVIFIEKFIKRAEKFPLFYFSLDNDKKL